MKQEHTQIGEQVHGYRSGHQLLSATIRLERSDQDIVDRLSDMAGQLRPGEVFQPYLTGYPLASGTYYVLAKTWQDLSAPRSGCVWTQSLLVPTRTWASFPDIFGWIPLFRNPSAEGLIETPPTTEFIPSEISDPRRFELVEALFLEERQPIVVFDCREAQVIALRVVNSLWTGLRSHFAFGTYALAPRSITNRPFDLIFAPSDARPRFADWPGRRIERAKGQVEKSRHRWTSDLVARVFEGRASSPDRGSPRLFSRIRTCR